MAAFRKWSKRAGLVGASAALALVALELWARFANPFGIELYRNLPRYFAEAIRFPEGAQRPDGRLFENQADAAVHFEGFDLFTTSEGLRSSERGWPRPGTDAGTDGARALRVLFLGDSVTLAWGVDDDESWVRSVEREGRAADGRVLECWNAGHLQYNSIQEADWLEAHGDRLAPDAVVLTFVVNDLDDAWANYQCLVQAQQQSAEAATWAQRWRGFSAEHLPGLHGLQVLWRERSALQKAPPPPTEAEKRAQIEPRWPACQSGLERVLSWCRSRDLPLVVLDHSTPKIPQLEEWCSARELVCHDLRFTPEEWELGLTLSLADAHANELGNRLLAEKALRALEFEQLCVHAP